MYIKIINNTTTPYIRINYNTTPIYIKQSLSQTYIKVGSGSNGAGNVESALNIVKYIRNKTGGTLARGTVVYINGATGNTATVAPALATSDATSAQTIGMLSSDIANNDFGYVVIIGQVAGLNTNAYEEGAQLYLSYTVAGAVTTTKPYAPYHIVYVAIVTRKHPNQGTVEVKVQNGYEMDELHNVAAQNPSDGDVLQYVSSTGLWTKTSSINFGTW